MATKIKSIKYVGQEEQQCITLDTDDGLYVTDDHIVTHNSCISMSNNLNFNIVSSNGDIIGQNIIMGSATELGFWREQGGWTDEQIYEFFTKLRDRIDSRMKGNRVSGFILDSSPNTMESVIDKWIWSEETRKSPKNLLFTGARWKFFKQDFKDCYDDYGNIKHDWNLCFRCLRSYFHHYPYKCNIDWRECFRLLRRFGFCYFLGQCLPRGYR